MSNDPLNPDEHDLLAEKLSSTSQDFKDLQELRIRLRHIRVAEKQELGIIKDDKE